MKKRLGALLYIILLVSCNSDDQQEIEEKSCCTEDSNIVEVNNLPEGKEIIPSRFFTPNGDGFHDVLDFRGLEDFPNNKVRVFLKDALVFETDNYGANPFGKELFEENFENQVYRYELEIDEGFTYKSNGYFCAIKVNTEVVSGCVSGYFEFDPIIYPR